MQADGKAPSPQIDPTAGIASTAIVEGDVSIGSNSFIGHGAIVVAESGPVRIGSNVVVMETAVLRGVKRCPLQLGSNILVGPRAYLTGCTIGDEVFLATGATVFNGAIVGDRAEVRVNGIVHLRTNLPPDSTVPLGWIAVGDPAQILPPESHDKIWAIQKKLDFPGFVFGVERPRAGNSFMPDVMPRYAEMLRRRYEKS